MRGRFSYSDRRVYENGLELLYTTGREDMHLVAKGSSLTHTTGQFLWNWYRKYSSFIKCTRIDLAFDDKSSEKDMNAIHSYFLRASIKTSARGYRVFQKNSSDNKDLGKTIYVGSSQSLSQVRIYDKAKEQGDFNSFWIRYEIQLRDIYAESAIRYLQDGGHPGSLILPRLDFLEEDGCGALWYRAIIGSDDSVRFSGSHEEDIEKTRKWVFQSVASSLYKLTLHYGNEIIAEILAEGRAKTEH